MQNIISYVKENNKTIAETPLQEVDMLIFSMLAYLKYQKLVPAVGSHHTAMSFRFFKRRKDFESLFVGARPEKDLRLLYDAVAASRRFRNLKLNYYCDLVDLEQEMQFSAVVFFLDDMTVVTFRGTDETLVGWKEDFNMTYRSPVPCQEESVRYLCAVAGQLSEKLILVGHSKGGNLAIYAGKECGAEIQERITEIHCFDGPGFRDNVYQEPGYLAIRDRICKIVPVASFVGMMLQNDTNYRVVKSRSLGLFQHDPFYWIVTDGHFEFAERIHRTTMSQNDTINAWISKLTIEQQQTLVDTLYNVLLASEATTVNDFKELKRENMLAVLNSFKQIDKETKRMLRQIISMLFKKNREDAE